MGSPTIQSWWRGRVAAIIQPAIDIASRAKVKPLNATLTPTLGYSSSDESAAGDLEADWMRALVPGADLAMTNSGGLRSHLDDGLLTYGRLYELLPFDNQRVVVSLTGGQLRTVIAANLQHSGSMVVLSGVRASAACERGTLTVALRRESGRPVGDSERLTVVTSDFLATGGDSFFVPVMPVRVVASGDLLRDEIATMLTRTGGRWGAERQRLPPRITYPGTRTGELQFALTVDRISDFRLQASDWRYHSRPRCLRWLPSERSGSSTRTARPLPG